jgi:hypothetical protein
MYKMPPPTGGGFLYMGWRDWSDEGAGAKHQGSTQICLEQI